VGRGKEFHGKGRQGTIVFLTKNAMECRQAGGRKLAGVELWRINTLWRGRAPGKAGPGLKGVLSNLKRARDEPLVENSYLGAWNYVLSLNGTPRPRC